MSQDNTEKQQVRPAAPQASKDRSSEKLVGAKEALKQKLLRAVMKQAMEEIGGPDAIAQKAMSAIDATQPPLPNAADKLRQLIVDEIASQAFSSVADSDATAEEIAASLSIDRAEIQAVVHSLRDRLAESIGNAAIATLADAELTATELSSRISSGRPEIQKVVNALRERVAASIRQDVLATFDSTNEVANKIGESIPSDDEKIVAVRDRLIETFLGRIKDETLNRLSAVDEHARSVRSEMDDEPAAVTDIADRLQGILTEEARERTLRSLEQIDNLVSEVLSSLGDNVEAVSTAADRVRATIVEEISTRAQGLIADVDSTAKSARTRIGSDPTEVVEASHRLKEILLQEIARRSADSVRQDEEAVSKALAMVSLETEGLANIRESLKKRILTQVLSSAISEIHDEVAEAASEVGLNLNIEDIVFDMRHSGEGSDASDVAELDDLIDFDVADSGENYDVLDDVAEKKSPVSIADVDTGAPSVSEDAVGEWRPLAEFDAGDSNQGEGEVGEFDLDDLDIRDDSDASAAALEADGSSDSEVPASNLADVIDAEDVEDVFEEISASESSSSEILESTAEGSLVEGSLDERNHEQVDLDGPDSDRLPEDQSVIEDKGDDVEWVSDVHIDAEYSEPEDDVSETDTVQMHVYTSDSFDDSEWAPRPTPTKDAHSVYYLYGILSTVGSALEGPTPLGINGMRVEAIDVDGLSAVVSIVPASSFTGEELKRNLETAAWLQENVRKHASIVEQLRGRQSLLPLAFCTIHPNRQSIEQMLRDGYDSYFDMLDLVDGKQEWGFRIYRNISTLEARVSDSDRRLEGAFSSISKGVVSYLRGETKRMDEGDQNAIQLMTEHCIQRSHDSVLSLAADGRQNPDGGGHPRENEDVVLNMAYLVPDDVEREIRAEVERLQSEYADLGFRFELTGPWPPYHFVSPDKARDTVRSGH